MEWGAQCILLGFLFVYAWIDYRVKEIPLFLLGICGAIGLLFSRALLEQSWISILGGVCVGSFLLLCSVLKKESVGMADGLLFAVTGIWLGAWQNTILLFVATVFCGVAGGALLLVKKCSRKESLSFAPFVLAAYVMIQILSLQSGR